MSVAIMMNKGLSLRKALRSIGSSQGTYYYRRRTRQDKGLLRDPSISEMPKHFHNVLNCHLFRHEHSLHLEEEKMRSRRFRVLTILRRRFSTFRSLSPTVAWIVFCWVVSVLGDMQGLVYDRIEVYL